MITSRITNQFDILATIETTRPDIDARDQVTHDHIRRVQKNAMRLARKLNVRTKLVRALEAAALLHDVGSSRSPNTFSTSRTN